MSIANAIVYTLLFFSLYFEVFVLVAFLESRLTRRGRITVPTQTDKTLPAAAIIVPCFNEERTIESTMRSLLALDYPADRIEFMIVDDGSKDRTHEIARTFASDSRVRVFRKENGGKHTAMNFALAHTNAELIGCLDADSTVDAAALRRIVPIFQDTRIAAVTPGIHVREPRTILQHMQNVEYRLSVFNRFILAALGSVFITPGPFSIFRSSVIRELGGWRYAHSTEDMEMALRIQKAGHMIANAPTAIVHTATPATFHGLYRQRVRWTYGWLRNAVDYRHMLGNRAFGNLGVLVLPFALISIGTGIFFFARIFLNAMNSLWHEFVRFQAVGVQPYRPEFDPFYLSTSTFWFLVLISVAIIVVLISVGSRIGTGSGKPPRSTPLFLLFYSFIAPIWLCAAVVRAVFKTGVRWR